jgi:MoxR-like ATPase
MGTERDALVGATNRFVAFFRELGDLFIEREDVLHQIALALLSREHVLVTGPPGTAKSKLAYAVLGRITCEQTHQPSLFARQFTESTVQTDLVGPIDFKTLMDTGRTEHFTDEGMLGATHAFLDEIFDGRDLLLRSTLNLLYERELKQGTKISRGKIECALMTSNRYLVEVLTSERLVAFVDRIGFLSFVPRGFGHPEALTEVVRQQVAGVATRSPVARLSIQDLDLMQDVVASVTVSSSLCSAVARLAQMYDAEAMSARRADPSFAPSRYVSTRAVVRLGELLRAVCFYDWAFGDRTRPLAARLQDLSGLRLGLTLCGPGLGAIDSMLAVESDPRERRQLTILRVEREIFERCLVAVLGSGRNAPPPLEPDLGDVTAASLMTLSTPAVVDLVRHMSLALSRDDIRSEELAPGLEAALQELIGRALRAGVQPGSDHGIAPLAVIGELGKMADHLDRSSSLHRRTSRWLRGKALALLTRVAALGPGPFSAGDLHARAAAGEQEAMVAISEAQLARAEQLASIRSDLQKAGADDPTATDESWKRAVEKVADRLWLDLGAGFAANVTIDGRGDRALYVEVERISPTLQILRTVADRLSALGGDGEAFFARAVSGPIESLVRRSLGALRHRRTAELAGAVAADIAVLKDRQLLALLPVSELAGWIAEALLRVEEHSPRPVDLGSPSHARYRALRGRMPPATLAYTLVELLGRLPALHGSDGDLDGVIREVAALVRGFSAEVRGQLVARDLAYLEAPIAYFEAWWQKLSVSLPEDPAAALETLMASKFFSVTHDESALARFDLEAQLMALVFEDGGVAAIRERIARLDSASGVLVQRLAVQRVARIGREAPRAESA